MKRLEVSSAVETQYQSSQTQTGTLEKPFESTYVLPERVHVNSARLLQLMGLSDNQKCVDLLEKICLQGKEMLGEVSRPTIASAPMSKASSKFINQETG